jgi:hypothetical protein
LNIQIDEVHRLNMVFEVHFVAPMQKYLAKPKSVVAIKGALASSFTIFEVACE